MTGDIQVRNTALRSVLSLLGAFEKELRRNLHIEFPYEDSRLAVEKLLKEAEQMKAYLQAFRSQQEPDPIVCILVRDFIASTVPLLGFILRSTNVRNSFEMHAPFRRLAKAFLDEGGSRKIHLLLSSEWDYSPLNEVGYGELLTHGYQEVVNGMAHSDDAKRDRPVFVLIGQPAPESSNPFFLPLAAHELGHSIWREKRFDDEFLADLKKAFPNETDEGQEMTEDDECRKWCSLQLQETFCDLIGVRVFGTSYLHAFRHFLAGCVGRSEVYPSDYDRAVIQKAMCDRYQFLCPKGFLKCFDQKDDKAADVDNELLSKVDEVRKTLTSKLHLMVDSIASERSIPMPDNKKRKGCLDRLRWFVPITGARSLADIMNAAWEAAHTENFFKNPRLNEQPEEHLKEVVLKSIEVFEIEQRMSDFQKSKEVTTHDSAH
ncbi:MAG: hypothetical protein U1F71_21305 [Verrucomicrobiaceae bacterium]